MLRVRQTLVLIGLAGVLTTFTLLSSGQERNQLLRNPKQRAIYILDNEKWHEDHEVWKALGWPPREVTQPGPNVISDTELGELLALIALMSNNAELTTYLERFVNHRNKNVAGLGLRELVRRGDWTQERAHRLARETGLPVEDYEFPSPEEHWKRLRASLKQPSDEQKAARVQDAVRILEAPQWHERDPGMAELRVNNERNPPEKRTPLEGHIRNREVHAIQTVNDSDLPRERKQELLTKYLSHHNKDVGSECFAAIVRSGMWPTERAVAYVRENNPTPGGWHTLLHYLPKEAPQAARQEIAREILVTARKVRPGLGLRSTPQEVIEAARVLLTSKQESDRGLIRWAVQEYPDAPVLWAAVSRVGPDEAVRRLADTMFADRAKPLPIRCAAGLVVGKDKPEVFSEILEHVLVALREFGTAEFRDWRNESWQHPADPTRVGRLRRAMEAESYIPIVFELPPDLLRENAQEILRYRFATLGGLAAEIVAKRIPKEFMRHVASAGPVSEELHEALFIAARADPEIAQQARSLIPQNRLEGLETSFKSHGPESLPIACMTLWD